MVQIYSLLLKASVEKSSPLSPAIKSQQHFDAIYAVFYAKSDLAGATFESKLALSGKRFLMLQLAAQTGISTSFSLVILVSKNVELRMRNVGNLLLLFQISSLFWCFFSLVDSSLTPLLSAFKTLCLDDQRSASVKLRKDFLDQSPSASNSKIGSWDLKTDSCSLKGVEYEPVGPVVTSAISRLTRLQSLDLSCQRDFPDSCSSKNHPALELKRPNFETFVLNWSSLLQLYLDDADISEQSTSLCEALSGALPNLRRLSWSNSVLSSPPITLQPEWEFAGSHFPIAKTEKPGHFRKPTPYRDVDLSENNFSGSLPPFHREGVINLKTLYLSSNQLNGIVFSSLFALPSPQSLDLLRNLLVGELEEFHNASSSPLTYLIIEGNNLKGPIPRSIIELPEHNVISLAYNNFTDCLGSIINLYGLNLEGNDFHSMSLNFDRGTKLLSLKLNSNSLEGKLPRSLANCSRLELLDLGNNMICDRFPSWLKKLPTLRVLVLRKNKFYGPTVDHTSDAKIFPVLQTMDLASNKFWEELFYGKIPEGIRNLKALIVLNLSRKGFTGRIPSLGSLTELESLDLSRNKLSGNSSSTDELEFS
ncbi:receptor-like protein 12 [Durio zibethinus]|uniref:Receptor-like protein 12 n=1 Tax=Durio zibethinus TaxID=66656 RepID=A0A6P6A516_DURZI|nr:receptor-like protein 12 [Durio zibethinus]